MYAQATTTISILRGNEGADNFGDDSPSDTPAYTGVIASIIDRRRVVVTQDSSEPNIVSFTDGRVGSETDIQYGDRIKDEKTGTLYAILDMNYGQNPFNTPDIILKLSRVRKYGKV